MKFIDTLSSMQYMGGALPIHISMAIYASYVYWKSARNVDQYPKAKEIDNYNDVLYMLICHVLCILMFIYKKTLSNSA